MPALKNRKAEACALLLAKGGISATQAYIKAFGAAPTSARNNASAAMAKYGVYERVEELKEKAAAEFTMSRTDWLEFLKGNAEGARDKDDFSASTGALREIGKAMSGWYAAEKTEVTVFESPEAIMERARLAGVLDK